VARKSQMLSAHVGDPELFRCGARQRSLRPQDRRTARPSPRAGRTPGTANSRRDRQPVGVGNGEGRAVGRGCRQDGQGAKAPSHGGWGRIPDRDPGSCGRWAGPGRCAGWNPDNAGEGINGCDAVGRWSGPAKHSGAPGFRSVPDRLAIVQRPLAITGVAVLFCPFSHRPEDCLQHCQSAR